MKNKYLLALGVIILLAIVWSLFIAYVNTRTTTFNTQIAKAVDKVEFYRADKADQPIATINTQGQDVSKPVELRNSAQYSFLMQTPPTNYYIVITKGSESFQSPTICCETGMANKTTTLTIDNLKNFQTGE